MMEALILMLCVALMGPRWTGRQRAMTQGWCQRGALLCNALQTDPECVRPWSLLLFQRKQLASSL